MAKYLASQIHVGKLNYATVIANYPELKDEIDKYLKQYNIIPTEDE